MTEPAGDKKDAVDMHKNWLVQGKAVTSGKLLHALADDPSVRLLKRLASDLVLLEMTASRAEELKTQFGPGLIIEWDQPVNPIE